MDHQTPEPSYSAPIVFSSPPNTPASSFFMFVTRVLLFIAANLVAYLMFGFILIVWGLFVVGLFNTATLTDDILLSLFSGVSYGVVIYAALGGKIFKKFKTPNIILISILGSIINASNLYLAYEQGSRIKLNSILLASLFIN